MKMNKILASVVTLLALSACGGGPDYVSEVTVGKDTVKCEAYVAGKTVSSYCSESTTPTNTIVTPPIAIAPPGAVPQPSN